MQTKLTRKQKGFVKDYVKTGHGTKSALNNYDTDDERVAQAIASENLSKPIIQKAIAERLPDDLLEEKHLALLNKRDVISGDIDVQAVKAGLDMAYKVKGTYAPDKSLNVNLNVTDGLTDEEKEGLRKLLKQ